MNILITPAECVKISSKLPIGAADEMEQITDIFYSAYKSNKCIFKEHGLSLALAGLDLFNAGRISGIREERIRRKGGGRNVSV